MRQLPQVGIRPHVPLGCAAPRRPKMGTGGGLPRCFGRLLSKTFSRRNHGKRGEMSGGANSSRSRDTAIAARVGID
jgi:hypothetical protein